MLGNLSKGMKLHLCLEIFNEPSVLILTWWQLLVCRQGCEKYFGFSKMDRAFEMLCISLYKYKMLILWFPLHLAFLFACVNKGAYYKQEGRIRDAALNLVFLFLWQAVRVVV